jgi:hypothetical protein
MRWLETQFVTTSSELVFHIQLVSPGIDVLAFFPVSCLSTSYEHYEVLDIPYVDWIVEYHIISVFPLRL